MTSPIAHAPSPTPSDVQAPRSEAENHARNRHSAAPPNNSALNRKSSKKPSRPWPPRPSSECAAYAHRPIRQPPDTARTEALRRRLSRTEPVGRLCAGSVSASIATSERAGAAVGESVSAGLGLGAASGAETAGRVEILLARRAPANRVAVTVTMLMDATSAARAGRFTGDRRTGHMPERDDAMSSPKGLQASSPRGFLAITRELTPGLRGVQYS